MPPTQAEGNVVPVGQPASCRSLYPVESRQPSRRQALFRCRFCRPAPGNLPLAASATRCARSGTNWTSGGQTRRPLSETLMSMPVPSSRRPDERPMTATIMRRRFNWIEVPLREQRPFRHLPMLRCSPSSLGAGAWRRILKVAPRLVTPRSVRLRRRALFDWPQRCHRHREGFDLPHGTEPSSPRATTSRRRHFRPATPSASSSPLT